MWPQTGFFFGYGSCWNVIVDKALMLGFNKLTTSVLQSTNTVPIVQENLNFKPIIFPSNQFWTTQLQVVNNILKVLKQPLYVSLNGKIAFIP